MLAKVQKWGNSQGIRLNRKILSQAKLEVGQDVDVTVKNNVVVLKPTHVIRGKYRIEDLIDKLPKKSRSAELDWGSPQGKEVW